MANLRTSGVPEHETRDGQLVDENTHVAREYTQPKIDGHVKLWFISSIMFDWI